MLALNFSLWTMRKLYKPYETSDFTHWTPGRTDLWSLWEGNCTWDELPVRRLFLDLKQSSVVLGNWRDTDCRQWDRWPECAGHITRQEGVRERILEICIGNILNLCLNSNLYMCRVLLTIYNQNQNQINQSQEQKNMRSMVVSLIKSHDSSLRSIPKPVFRSRTHWLGL